MHNIVMDKTLKKDYIKLHISVLLAGFTGIFGKLISLNEIMLVWYRLLFAFAIFYLILLMAKKIPRETSQNILKICGIGALLGIHFLLFFGSIKYSNVAVGVVCYSLVGFFTAIFEPLIYKRAICSNDLIFSLLAVAGISLIFNIDTHFRFGIILGILSSAVFAFYTILNKLYGKNINSRNMLFYELLGGSIFITAILPCYFVFANLKFCLPSIGDFVYLLILAFFCTVGLYILHIQVLRRIPAFTVSLCGNLEPVYGILLAMIFCGEAQELSLSFYSGMALILFSVFLQSFISTRKRIEKIC